MGHSLLKHKAPELTIPGLCLKEKMVGDADSITQQSNP